MSLHPSQIRRRKLQQLQSDLETKEKRSATTTALVVIFLFIPAYLDRLLWVLHLYSNCNIAILSCVLNLILGIFDCLHNSCQDQSVNLPVWAQLAPALERERSAINAECYFKSSCTRLDSLFKII